MDFNPINICYKYHMAILVFLFITSLFTIYLLILRKKVRQPIYSKLVSYVIRFYTFFLVNRTFRWFCRILILFIFMQFMGIGLPTVLADEIAEIVEQKNEEKDEISEDQKKEKKGINWKGIAIWGFLSFIAWVIMRIMFGGGDSSGPSGGSDISSTTSDTLSDSERALDKETNFKRVLDIRTDLDFAAADLIKYNNSTSNHIIEVRRDEVAVKNILMEYGLSYSNSEQVKQVVVSIVSMNNNLSENEYTIYRDLPTSFFCACHIWINEFQNSMYYPEEFSKQVMEHMMTEINQRENLFH